MSVRKCLSIVSAALLVVVSLALESSAQVSASIGGTVSDLTGALIPGVEVAATNVNTGITTTQVTNEAGAYQIPSVQPGTYRLNSPPPKSAHHQSTIKRAPCEWHGGADVAHECATLTAWAGQ